METANLLARVVVRSFYEEKHAVLMDFLLREKMLPDDVLADRMRMMVKDVNKIAARLREDRIIFSEVRQEVRSTDHKNISRTYYYVDLGRLADVVKYRLHRMRKALEDRVSSELETRGYLCPFCKRSYTFLDVQRLLNPTEGTFECEACRTELQSYDASMFGAGSGNTSVQAQSKLMDQTSQIRKLLKHIDDLNEIPRFDPVEFLRGRESFEFMSGHSSSSFASSTEEIKSPNTTSESALSVELVSESKGNSISKKSSGTNERLPIWHTHSTVTGALVSSSSVRSNGNRNDPDHATHVGGHSESLEKEYLDRYEKEQLSSSKRSRTEAPEEESVQGEQQEQQSEMVTVKGVPKKLGQITEHDKNQMTDDEYQKYYEAYMSHCG